MERGPRSVALVGFLLARVDEDERRAADQWPPGGDDTWLDWIRTVCETKRRIVDLHCRLDEVGEGWWDPACSVAGLVTSEPGGCRTLMALATSYAEHPDFQPEWRG